MVNTKRYTSIDWYQNILFRWQNRYSLGYEIDSLDQNNKMSELSTNIYASGGWIIAIKYNAISRSCSHEITYNL